MVNPQPYSVAAYASALNGQSQSVMSNNPIGKVRPRRHQEDSEALCIHWCTSVPSLCPERGVRVDRPAGEAVVK